MERSRGYRRKFDLTDDRFGWLSNLAWGPNPEMDQLINGEMDEKSSTPIQKLFSKAYGLYQQKYENQERLRQNEAHISRLCTALCSLSNLVSLYLKDDDSWGSDKLAAADFVDSGFGRTVLQHFDSAIRKSRWCGSFQTTHSAIPPLEMLGPLCSQLGENGLRPRALWFSLMPPPNMEVWELSSTQQGNLRQLVSQSTDLKLDVDFFSRHHSLSGNPRHEMLALCSITQPFFSAPNLERMDMTFREYPRYNETPNVSLGDILPLGMSWPRLQTLHLRHIPATIKELESLVSRHSTTVRDFLWISGWLLEGSWADAFDTIRSFKALEDAKLRFPSGGDDGIKDLEYRLPADEIRSYLLRETDNNPLYNITEPSFIDNEHW
ncbi:hypothetical protein NM208_g2296 [Fusarium decemcellulare]|uniref:Uncharacterized protein n=2 Tax=Fusarium decemcellulare TaxID=57161 RepID=A0ACC1ST45_9HYPO|nr:hypothetical protein NM208_g3503 [Fusarium decemcellulare]KAJ3545855.1 hypothetical protein NM208_g2296 [Fusarium decemcellulare]